MEPGFQGCQRDSKLLCQLSHRVFLRYPNAERDSQFWIEPLDRKQKSLRPLTLITSLVRIHGVIRNIEVQGVIAEAWRQFK